METTSINTIKSLLADIQQNLDAFREYHKTRGTDMDVCSYGSENEYSLKGVIGGIKNILIDLRFLVRSHKLFLKLSAYTERKELIENLRSLNTSIVNNQTPQIVVFLDTIKSRLRSYNLRNDRDRQVDYSKALDDLCRKAIELEESIKDVTDKLTQASEIYTKIEGKQAEYDVLIQALSNKKDEFVAEYDAFVSEVGDFRLLAEKAKVNEQTIDNKLKKAEENKKVFDEFIAKINEREKEIEKQNEATIDYENKLYAFSKEQQEKLSEVTELIKKAMQALQYTTAAGMSAAYQEQYDKANNKCSKIGWLVAAALFLVLTLFIGAWIVTGWGIKTDGNTQLLSLIGRLSMVPFTILAAIFCANQYVKQKNLAEDYAYKSVLTKSIVAFSEELREKDEKGYSEYISTVLKEIHQDPLRKRCKEKDEITIKETAGILGKALDTIQSFSQKA